MTKRLVFILPLLLTLLLASFFLWSLRSGRDPNALPSVLIDKPAPAFKATPLEGYLPFSSNDLADGKVKLLNFFASWCLPCHAEHPHLVALAEQTDLNIYGLAYKDSVENITTFLQQKGNPYHAISMDEQGRIGIDFGLYGVPETYLIDARGHIRYRFAGPLDAKIINAELIPMISALRSEGGGE